MDIHPLTAKPVHDDAFLPTAAEPAQHNPAPQPTVTAKQSATAATLPKPETHDNKVGTSTTPEEASTGVDQTKTTDREIRQSVPPESIPDRTATALPGTEPERPDVKPQPKSNPLQFYLVVTLVAITIIILALLLVMLLARHRWAEDKDVPNVNDFLKHQDKRIAALNERIKEQFKRYEEA